MSIYRKTIDFPEEYRSKMRRVANAHPDTFKSEQGHVASVNALIIKAVDIFLEPLLTQLNESPTTTSPVTTDEVITNLVERGIISSPVDILDDLPAIVDLSANALQPFPATEE